jgi:hypothetical protein
LAEDTKKVLWVKSARILEAWSLSFATCPNNSSLELGGILVVVSLLNLTLFASATKYSKLQTAMVGTLLTSTLMILWLTTTKMPPSSGELLFGHLLV